MAANILQQPLTAVPQNINMSPEKNALPIYFQQLRKSPWLVLSVHPCAQSRFPHLSPLLKRFIRIWSKIWEGNGADKHLIWVCIREKFPKKGTSQLIPSSLLETIVAFAVVWLEKFVRFHRLENSPGQLTYTVLGTECNFVPKNTRIQVYIMFDKNRQLCGHWWWTNDFLRISY